MHQIIFALLFCFACSSAMAGGKSYGKEHSEAIIKELNLTNDQTKQVKHIKDKYGSELDKQKQEARAVKQALRKMLQAPERGSAYRKKLMAQFKEYQNLKQNQNLQRFEMALDIRELLTNEQLVKFRGFHQKDHSGR